MTLPIEARWITSLPPDHKPALDPGALYLSKTRFPPRRAQNFIDFLVTHAGCARGDAAS